MFLIYVLVKWVCLALIKSKNYVHNNIINIHIRLQTYGLDTSLRVYINKTFQNRISVYLHTHVSSLLSILS